MMNDYSHFKKHVPKDIMVALEKLAKHVHTEMYCTIQEAVIEAKINVIHGNPYSGFYPFQDGGYRVNTLIQSGVDNSYHITIKQTEEMERQNKNCWESFLNGNELLPETEYDDLSEKQQEELQELESEWFEPAFFEFECWVDQIEETDVYEIFVRVSLNYKDAPYYRSEYAETIFEETLTDIQFVHTDSGQYAKQLMSCL